MAFKLLGGRFWAISPSSYTHIGSFARWSIPCTEKYATPTQRTMIERMGEKWGCHTCGSRMLHHKRSASFRFVGDHMPPKSVAEQMNKSWLRRFGLLPKVQFRFYPQCVHCSNTQGSILSQATQQWKQQQQHNQQRFKRLLFGRSAEALKESGGGRMAYFHGWKVRVNHWTGGLIAAAIVVGGKDQDIVKGNPKRLEQWQHTLEQTIKKFHHY
jgi:hypothetical protein